ncbi:MAG: glycoside hydrolase family 32 protein [Haliscomenobacter sp.]|uniref:glycoside hydrolase family 32 protein n=1 Tax=Haliscomenobacter sp. TaxID=2717303 RepID=UPI0029BCB37A|nr:glycoside hydrolase family 32 protein [Haliscomenobacter sp.]MDX2068505.1 glycoside hydrolase family 32 protein [Haliscomenobacter sp.]
MKTHLRTIVYLLMILLAEVKGLAQTRHYHEPHRPQFHFSPPYMWMNDPNGMVYYKGEYHLFYQHYPEDKVWGPMHWGHAVSKDLVYWRNLPIALYPDSLGYIFSGSAVIDWKNTSGFGINGQPPMVAMFTHHLMAGEKAGRSDFQYQSIAYSNDAGRTWTKYQGNPVIPNPGIRDFRDTKVIWHEGSKQWIVVLAAQNQVRFYGSPDLKNWTFLSNFGAEHGNHSGVWECPDFFPLKVAGNNQNKWVLIQSINPGGPNGGSATQYFIGEFDGKTFRNDNAPDKVLWMDWGRDNYAGVTWSDAPEGRRLFMGWMSNWDYAQNVPTHPWRSATTVVRELSLRQTPEGLRIFSQAIPEQKKLRAKGFTLPAQSLSGTLDVGKKSGLSPAQLELELEVMLPSDPQVKWGLELSNASGEKYRMGMDAVQNQFFSDRRMAGKHDFSKAFGKAIHIASRESKDHKVKMHILLDVSSVELFADEGRVVLTDLFFPTTPFDSISLFCEGGKVDLMKGQLWVLKGIWK